MRIRTPGKIENGLWFLGCEESCIYLLEGRGESMLISGGISCIVPRVVRQLEEFNIDTGKIKKLLILHAHFDHVGVIPFFRQTHPDIEIYASARAWEILGMPKALNTINEFGRSAADHMKMPAECSGYDLDWHADISGTAVSEGDIIDVGETKVHIIETPGHSSCSISAYVPQLKALFPSDGGGMPFKQTIITLGNSNYTRFQESLEKLAKYPVKYLCADHYGVVSGDEAKNYISCSIRIARRSRTEMETVYRDTGDIEAASKKLSASFCTEHDDYLLPPEIIEGIFRQMVRHIAGVMEAGGCPSRNRN